MKLEEVKDNLILAGGIYLGVCFTSSFLVASMNSTDGVSCKVDTPWEHIVYSQLFCPTK